MLGNIFQLAGALMTILAIVSRNSDDIWKSLWSRIGVPDRKGEKVRQGVSERNFGVVGAIYILLGYIFPTGDIDISLISNDSTHKIIDLVVCALALVLVGASVAFAAMKIEMKFKK